jgi:hypothetical protein
MDSKAEPRWMSWAEWKWKAESLNRLFQRQGVLKHQDFCDKYARARERQADFMAAQTVDIADDTSKGQQLCWEHCGGTVEAAD